VELTREEDHRRTMDLLGIETLRRGANGSDPEAENYANYDEALATPYRSLPDPLLTNERVRVTTPEQWWSVRRPEIVELFDREIYGREPASTPGVAWEVVAERDTALSGSAARIKQLVGRVDNAGYPAVTVEMQAVLVTPANAGRPVPVIVQFGFVSFGPAGGGPGGPGGPAPVGAGGAGGQAAAGPGWQQQLLEKGWGYAVLAPNSIQADNGAGLTRGIIGLVNRGQPRKLDDWGALREWAWQPVVEIPGAARRGLARVQRRRDDEA
jgi:hypothetical protein